MSVHPFEERYRIVFDRTRAFGELTEANVQASRFFFEQREGGIVLDTQGSPIPRRFDTFGMVCALPMPEPMRSTLERLWTECIAFLPSAVRWYGVEPANRHLEIFLFQRPGDIFAREEIDDGVARSRVLVTHRQPFTVHYRFPFLTPDGTIVTPGFDDPPGTVDALRAQLRDCLSRYPERQSQWFHTPLGRILDPIDAERLHPLLVTMERRWGEAIGSVTIDEVLWTHERQWYMVDRAVLHRNRLSSTEVSPEHG